MPGLELKSPPVPAEWAAMSVRQRIMALLRAQGRTGAGAARLLGLNHRESFNQRLWGDTAWRAGEPERLAAWLGVPMNVIWDTPPAVNPYSAARTGYAAEPPIVDGAAAGEDEDEAV